MKRKFFSYLHVSDHPLPRVVTAALVAAHVSVGAGTVVAAPPGLQAGVGAVLAGVLLTCTHTLHPLWPLSGLSLASHSSPSSCLSRENTQMSSPGLQNLRAGLVRSMEYLW